MSGRKGARATIIKAGGHASDEPTRFRVEDSMLFVNLPNVSALVTPDDAHDGHTRLSTGVSQRVFDAIDLPLEGTTKVLNLGNGVTISIYASPIGGMTRDEIDALTDEEWAALVPELDVSPEDQAQIDRIIEEIERDEAEHPPHPAVDL